MFKRKISQMDRGNDGNNGGWGGCGRVGFRGIYHGGRSSRRFRGGGRKGVPGRGGCYGRE